MRHFNVRTSFCFAAFLGFYMLTVTGCGPTAESSISGVVTYEGKSLTSGTVTFEKTGGGSIAYGSIQNDGTYKVKTGSGKGLDAGEYYVGVVCTELPDDAANQDEEIIPKSLIPEKYNVPKTSGLKFTVQPGSNTYDIPLKP